MRLTSTPIIPRARNPKVFEVIPYMVPVRANFLVGGYTRTLEGEISHPLEAALLPGCAGPFHCKEKVVLKLK